MNYAIKTPNNLDIFAIVLNGSFPHGPLPSGKTPIECGMWSVDLTIPSGFQQDYSQGIPPGWQLVNNVVVPCIVAIPTPAAPTAEIIWHDKLAGSIVDISTGIEIEANEAVRNLLTGQLVMVTTALNLGAITINTPQDIWDAFGVKHTMTTLELISLILRHGAAWQAMFAEFAP